MCYSTSCWYFSPVLHIYVSLVCFSCGVCMRFLSWPRAGRSFSFFPIYCRCPYLTSEYSLGIPIYEGLLTFFVLATFANATFMDPGIIPRGKHSNVYDVYCRVISSHEYCVDCACYRRISKICNMRYA